MTVYFRPVRAWTFIGPGDAAEAGREAAAKAASIADRPLKKREHEALVTEFVRLAEHQQRIGAPDFAVLTATRRPVRTVAWLAVHFVDDDGMLDRVLEDSWDERRQGSLLEDPLISTVRTTLGPATRVLMHHRPEGDRPSRRAPSMTTVRYVQPFEDDLRDRTLLVTASVPLDVDRDTGVDHIDRFVMSMTTDPRAGDDTETRN